jgi:hypothetical protein
MMKIEGSGFASESGSDTGMDLRIRIHTKMSWIRNTAIPDLDINSVANPLNFGTDPDPQIHTSD